MSQTLEQLMSEIPKVHEGGTRTYAVDERIADLLHRQAPGAVTAETGSGLSTVVLLNGGVRQHFAIQPDPAEFERICRYCDARGIPTGALVPIAARSQEHLPTADLPMLDLVLIDGAHFFPIPFFDWFYLAPRLKVGGLLIVDDIQILTGTILADFLSEEPGWTVVDRDRTKTRYAVFRREEDKTVREGDYWQMQPYLARNCPTRHLAVRKWPPKGLVERVAGRVLPWRIQSRLRQRYHGWPRPSWWS